MPALGGAQPNRAKKTLHRRVKHAQRSKHSQQLTDCDTGMLKSRVRADGAPASAAAGAAGTACGEQLRQGEAAMCKAWAT